LFFLPLLSVSLPSTQIAFRTCRASLPSSTNSAACQSVATHLSDPHNLLTAAPFSNADLRISVPCSIPPLSIERSFGRIPAPCSFASSAFLAPPNKSFETATKIYHVPPKMQTLALGAVSTRFRVPQFQEVDTEQVMYIYVKWNSFGLRFARRRFRH